MIPLILFILLGLTILVLFEWRARKDNQELAHQEGKTDSGTTKQTDSPDGCCGQHLVCERETLLQTNAEIVYYDDEELDTLSGKAAEEYTEAEIRQIREVFETLQEKDVPGWVRSLQLRNIQLPMDVREEALLIVVERRKR